MRTLPFTLVSVGIALSACGSGPSTEGPSERSEQTRGNLQVAANIATDFDATYSLGSAWARARVSYTPTTTFYEITTSQGTTILRMGTAIDARVETNLPDDPRTVDGIVRLSSVDPEYPIVKGLLEALETAGATPRPTRVQAGTTLYGAAYFAAKALGQVKTILVDRTNPAKPTRPTQWPYPGFYRKGDMPPVLRVDLGQQNGGGDTTCCGPFNCVDADWNPSISCDDWCAAGDACNAWGWGGCGTPIVGPPGGCNWCPHSNSWTIQTSDPYGCNNGGCSPGCYDPTPTQYGPASNFDYFGDWYFGAGGGEYGYGPDDHWN